MFTFSLILAYMSQHKRLDKAVKIEFDCFKRWSVVSHINSTFHLQDKERAIRPLKGLM